jgi:anti-sigma regulatory factor (Ser/Thr protein kinase)
VRRRRRSDRAQCTPPPRVGPSWSRGSSLLLYTDGLVEDREHQLDAGMPQLMARLSASVDRDPGTVLACALSAAPQHRADDVAVLVVQRSEPAVVARTPLQELDRELVLPSSFEQLSSARRWVRALLEQAGVDDDTTFELLVAMSEAINNAVEHARDPARAEIVVRVHVGAEARQVRLEVRDFGQWRPRRPSMDRGHGASLMSAAGEVEVLAEPDGTRVSVIRQL